MNAHTFRAIIGELIDENPLACRALLKILDIEFTEKVPTLAVTVTSPPRMLVNLSFIEKHCHNEAHVKAVVCHEFLHVLLRHTERIKLHCNAENFAMDAVINAIIHRQMGPEYSSMMLEYYEHETGINRLLRPCCSLDSIGDGIESDWLLLIWDALYEGKLVADDILELAKDQQIRARTLAPGGGYLGNHESEDEDGPDVGMCDEVVGALDRAMQSMNGDGIWRSPKDRGIGTNAYINRVTAADAGVERWCRETFAVLKRYLIPDPGAPRTFNGEMDCRLPILTPHDRRAFARALWSPLIPEAIWKSSVESSAGSAQIYLDVSGSMNAEMPLIISLLGRLGGYIRRPFWAFSDEVVPAVISNNQLVAATTGGTTMSCVLVHLAKTRPAAAVVVTDGYIEELDPALVRQTRSTRLHAIVTRDGSPHELREAGISYTQLGKVPQ